MRTFCLAYIKSNLIIAIFYVRSPHNAFQTRQAEFSTYLQIFFSVEQQAQLRPKPANYWGV
jgi:hypothetical protein